MTETRRLDTWTRALLLALLYLVPALLSIRSIVDPDMFWHLKTGEWVLQHGAVPATDPFSTFGQDKPWVAYSWLFEVVFHELHHVLGWSGVFLYRFVLWVAIAVALHRVVRRLQPSFPGAFLVTAFGLAALTRLTEPRPWLLTILFFTVELELLRHARETGLRWPLVVLAGLFALWANVHIQFVYGLALLGVETLDAWFDPKGKVTRLAGTTVACALATLVNPYHVHVWGVVHEYATETRVFALVTELQPIRFRSAPDWFVLGLALAAAFTLGLRRDRSPGAYLLLALASFCSFRAQRDSWFVTIVACALAARVPLPGGPPPSGVELRALALTGIVVAATIGLWINARDRFNEWHEKVISANFPDGAVRYVEANRLQGPLFNAFGWGGYLIWRLPSIPVSMDGRTNLHGEERIARESSTLSGSAWRDDPELARARLVILSVDKYPLPQLLMHDERFRIVYSDDVAAVFVAR